MKYILIADLHITKDSNPQNSAWVRHFCTFICDNAGIDRLIVFVLGDIIDRGETAGAEGFERADAFFDYIKNQAKPHSVHFVFLPGNHDYQGKSLKLFQNLCRRHQSPLAADVDFTKARTWNLNTEHLNFILTDSVKDGDYASAGQLDCEGIIKKTIPGKTNILLMHHRLFSEDSSSSGGIVDQKKTLRTLKELGIKYVFCGHAHASRNASDSDNINVFGIGPLGVSEEEQREWTINEAEQFDVLETNGGIVQSVVNMLYRSGDGRYVQIPIYPPLSPQYEDGSAIPHIEYGKVEGYISRQLTACENGYTNGFNAFGRPKQSLTDICLSMSYVLLIADAGLGKSTELKNLACAVATNLRHVRPVFLSLRDYSGGPLKAFIDTTWPQYRTLNPAQFLLILDGFDELKNDSDFKQALKQYIREQAESHICISMRSNFYRPADEVFTDFAVFRLEELSAAQIIAELERRRISVPHFLAECEHRQLDNLLKSPFYLNELCSLYQMKGELPVARWIMAEIIQRHIQKDIRKYEYAKKLDDHIHETRTALTRLAVSMQLLHCSRLEEDQYQSLFSAEERELLRYSGLTVSTVHGHEFLHNIFREYLTAEYLSELPTEEVISLITIPGLKKLDIAWVNTVGFALQLREDRGLFDWITEIEPLMLVRLEKDRVLNEKRFEILKKTVEQITRDRIWPDYQICTVSQLAAFSQSERSLTYLLEIIAEPPHIWTLGFCLSVLAEYTELYGRADIVREALITCFKRDDLSRTVSAVAIETIASLGLQTDVVTEELKAVFFSIKSARVRFAVYSYLAKAHLINGNVDFLLKAISYIRGGSAVPDPVSNEEQKLMECLAEVDSPEAVHCVLQWAFTAEQTGKGLSRSAAATILATAAGMFERGEDWLFDDVLRFQTDYTVTIGLTYGPEIISFFEKTNTLERALRELVCTPSEDRLFLVEKLLKARPRLFDCFFALYRQGEMDEELFADYARQCQDSVVFERCVGQIKEKTGETIPEPAPRPDYEKLKAADKQRFFNALFDEELAESLLTELLDFCGNKEIRIGELRHVHLRRFMFPTGSSHLWYAIIGSGLDESLQVKDFFRLVDRKRFTLHHAIRLLTEGGVSVSEGQIKWLREAYEKFEKDVDPHTAYCETEGGATYSLDLDYYLCLKRLFSWPSPGVFMLGLLEVPYYCIVQEQSYDLQEKYAVLEKELDKETIIARIVELLQTERRIAILNDLIAGCERYNMPDAVVAAVELCLRSEVSSVDRQNAAQYILSAAGPDFLIQNVLPGTDDFLFEAVIPMLHGYDDTALLDQISDRFSQKHSPALLRETIFRGMPEGLSYYIEKSRELKQPVDASPGGIPSITEEIESIGRIELLPLLAEAAGMLCAPDFRDASLGSLDRSLKKAYRKCAALDYQQVIGHLTALKESNPKNDRLSNFCNATLESITYDYAENTRKKWEIREVRKIISVIE